MYSNTDIGRLSHGHKQYMDEKVLLNFYMQRMRYTQKQTDMLITTFHSSTGRGVIKYPADRCITDPPMMARNGRSGCSSALAKYVSSFLSRKPDARCGSWQPTIELNTVNKHADNNGTLHTHQPSDHFLGDPWLASSSL